MLCQNARIQRRTAVTMTTIIAANHVMMTQVESFDDDNRLESRDDNTSGII